jgi:hypothetical protein
MTEEEELSRLQEIISLMILLKSKGWRLMEALFIRQGL